MLIINKQIRPFITTVTIILLLFYVTKTESKPMDFMKEFMRMAEYLTDYDYDDDFKSDRSSSSRSSATELCILPARKGHCRALLPRWRYDPVTKNCDEFKFGGCDGNANNFLSYEHCMSICKGI